MSVIAIITARGGSKRIPRKNVRPFLGTPIICYPIRAAMESRCFDEVMVSTDDPEIAAVARAAGATMPFSRSAATSDDHSTTAEVLTEVLTEYQRRARYFDIACCLYPTAPFITPEDLAAGLHLLRENPEIDNVVPVVRFSYPIFRAFKIERERLAMIWPENRDKRSQDLPVAYHDVGQFYWFRVAPFLRSGALFSDRTAPLERRELAVQDIDHEEDWLVAEAKYQVFQSLRSRGN